MGHSVGPLTAHFYVIGSSSEASTLTATFAGNTSGVFSVGREMGQAIIYVSYTPKTGESNRFITLRYEFGPANNDLYQVTKLIDVSGSSNLLEHKEWDGKLIGATGGTEYKRRIAIPVADRFGRISVKEDGSSNFGTVKIRLTEMSRGS